MRSDPIGLGHQIGQTIGANESLQHCTAIVREGGPNGGQHPEIRNRVGPVDGIAFEIDQDWCIHVDHARSGPAKRLARCRQELSETRSCR